MRHYEIMVILDPELEERTVAPSLEHISRSSKTVVAPSTSSISGAVVV
jgi:ribosomal protein S6